ncbi:hypothetical protein CYY_000503 [Polysphondylium violaceum]|uniref:RIC1 C-terminal alpha solenoid region domain-containing protein n=1 Tax=Polysphondylium violaceum TaxID=133409 RepID=A0A8J4PZQ2_9MYCE|nr:hypothetical protein CYY_000503 [Polysphondylium violaceum]
MYFTFGWPKIYFSEIQENFIDVTHNSNCSLIAFIGSTSLSIWSGDQHRIQLGYTIRSEDSINTFGKNEKLCWSPDSSSIAIITSTGYILVYRIEREGIDVLNFKFYKEHHSPYLQHDKRKISIKFSSSFKPSVLGALCFTSNNEYIFIFSKEGYLVKSSWTGELINQFSLDIVPFDSLNDQHSGGIPSSSPLVVTKVFYNPSYSIFGLVFDNGASAILKKKSKDKLRGYWLSRENSVSIALNLKHRLAAVGLKNGDVLIYELPGPVSVSSSNNNNNNNNSNNKAAFESMNNCKYLRTFSLLQFRELTPDAIGPISEMKWTHDENCLAVGWKNRGFCLWSVYGCKLACTIPQMNDMMFSTRYIEPCKEGVLAFSFGPESYHLVLLSNGNHNGEFFQLTFLKASLASNPSLNYSERIILQTEDRLMLLNYKGKELGDIRWKHLQIPSIYLNDNWPIRHIALSRDRNQYAVAGKRGIILYNSLNKRWKMFGDRNQEQEIESQCLAWYKSVVIVANYSLMQKKHEFLLYPKQHLDNSSLLYRYPIPQNQSPALLDCNDLYLTLLTNESFFYLFKFVEKNSTIELHLVHMLSMSVPSIPLSISLLPPIQVIYNSPNTATTSNFASPSKVVVNQQQFVYCLILYASGKLCLANAENALQHELTNEIEQYWFTNIYRDKELIGNTLWAYGKSGIKVWFPFSSEEIYTNKNLHHNRSLNFDNEVYPVGFLNELGVIVGLSQGISYSSCSAYPNYEIRIKTHPFLHSILKHLLERGGAEKAWNLSNRFYTIPHFTHSLELLLHETISDDDVKLSKPKIPKIEYVVNFLKKFPQFPEVVMRCTRKIDASLWKDLFKYIGDPVALYQKCLSNGRIEIAASYLKILQNLISDDCSRKCAIELLEIVLDFDNIDLAGDLVRFLYTSDDELDKCNGQVDDDDTAVEEEASKQNRANRSKESKLFYKNLDSILSSYASKLLKAKLLRNFLLFSRKTLCDDISTWLLSKKRSTILRTVEDLDMALNSIHVQFYINLPYENIPPFSPNSVLSAFSPTPSPTPGLLPSFSSSSIGNILTTNSEDEYEDDLISLSDSIGNMNNTENTTSTNNNNNTTTTSTTTTTKTETDPTLIAMMSQSPPTMVTKHEMIESLKSRIQQTGKVDVDVVPTHQPTHVYSFKSHQFMVAPIPSGNDFNDPYFLKESIDSSMDDLYYLLQELTNAGCYEWVLVIATVLLNTTLICKTLKKVPNIYENYCKMLSHQKPVGYALLLNFVEENVYPYLQLTQNDLRKQLSSNYHMKSSSSLDFQSIHHDVE